ncbi:MAG: helix-turn-helix domain-containing protein [Ruthenibacterium sp.]
MKTNETMGARMQTRRTALGLTLQQVADAAGVTKSAVSRYERDAFQTPREVVVAAIAAALHVSPAWLMGRTDNPAATTGGTVSDAELKFALFGGSAGVTNAQFEEVKRFAAFVKERDRHDDN